jgi:flavin-binding protein dodecin
MKCKRCEAAEDRINGFCSVYCEDMAEVEAENKRLREALEAISWMSVVMPDGSVNTTASYHARVALEEGVSLVPRKETKGEISDV